MYDRKTIRRRRAVLALLVGCSVILLTASFGDGLRSVERGALEVFAPIQEGASKALKPVRDAAGWVTATIDAKDEVEELRAERDRLRVDLSQSRGALRENDRLRALLRMDERLDLAEREPLTALVVSRPSSEWTSTIQIDKGRGDGVREGQPVVASGGLVGRVQTASRGSAIVQLITDEDSGVAARVNENDVAGIVEAEVGNPSDLRLQYVGRVENVDRGQTIVTAGSVDERFGSDFPRGLPIGRVAEVDDDDRVRVRPFANTRSLDYVQVLLRPGS